MFKTTILDWHKIFDSDHPPTNVLCTQTNPHTTVGFLRCDESVRAARLDRSHLSAQVKAPCSAAARGAESEEEGWKNSAADIYPPRPHESRMWKLTPALSLHFLRVPIVYVFVWMTVDFSASLSSGFVGPCSRKAQRETEYKRALHQINSVGEGWWQTQLETRRDTLRMLSNASLNM